MNTNLTGTPEWADTERILEDAGVTAAVEAESNAEAIDRILLLLGSLLVARDVEELDDPTLLTEALLDLADAGQPVPVADLVGTFLLLTPGATALPTWLEASAHADPYGPVGADTIGARALALFAEAFASASDPPPDPGDGLSTTHPSTPCSARAPSRRWGRMDFVIIISEIDQRRLATAITEAKTHVGMEQFSPRCEVRFGPRGGQVEIRWRLNPRFTKLERMLALHAYFDPEFHKVAGAYSSGWKGDEYVYTFDFEESEDYDYVAGDGFDGDNNFDDDDDL